MNELPLITILLLTLLGGSVLVWLTPSAQWARVFALLTSVAGIVISMLIVSGFNSEAGGFQYVEKVAWIPTLNINYLVGVDGISLLFLPLTATLFTAVILASWNRVRTLPRTYYSLLILFEVATIGVFCALDTILFFFFWELTLIPVYFLITLWGEGMQRRYAAVKYTLFMMGGGVLLLLAFVFLAFSHKEAAFPPELVFSYQELLQHQLDFNTQLIVFLLLLGGFAFKAPLIPLHSWLPVVAVEGPVSVATLMTGLKLGVYGIIRFVIPLAPEAAQALHWLLAGLGVLAILYGALLAMRQTNLRSMLAFSSISHVGLVLLGISSFNHQGIQGAVFQLLNFTVVAGGIFLLTGFVHRRIGSTEIASLGGLARHMPVATGFFFFFGLAGMGVPGTSSFPAEFLMIVSALKTHTGAGLAALFGVVIGAGYFLSIYRRTFLGPTTSAVVASVPDLNRRELFVVVIFSLFIIAAGIYPPLVMDVIEHATVDWVGLFN